MWHAQILLLKPQMLKSLSAAADMLSRGALVIVGTPVSMEGHTLLLEGICRAVGRVAANFLMRSKVSCCPLSAHSAKKKTCFWQQDEVPIRAFAAGANCLRV